MRYLIAILIILFASFADIFLFRIDIVPVKPSEFLVPLFLLLCVINYRAKVIDLLRTHSAKFFIVILLFSVVYAAFSPASFEVIKTEIILNIFTIMMYLFLLHFFRSEPKTLSFLVVFISFVILSGSVWYDYLVGLPKFNITLEEMVRKGGFGENPNQAASAMKFLALSCLVFLFRDKSKRIMIIILMVASVFLTLSRSGIVSVILILMFGALNNWDKNFKLDPRKLFTSFFKMSFLFVGLYLGLVFFSELAKEHYPEFSQGAAGERIDAILGKSSSRYTSSSYGLSGRGDLFLKYWNDFKKNPLGVGTGFSSDLSLNPLSTHNYYLYLAVNFGVLALILYLVYLFFGFNISIKHDQFYYLIFIILILFEGFVTSRIFFNRSMLISLAFFDSLIYAYNFTSKPKEVDQLEN